MKSKQRNHEHLAPPRGRSLVEYCPPRLFSSKKEPWIDQTGEGYGRGHGFSYPMLGRGNRDGEYSKKRDQPNRRKTLQTFKQSLFHRLRIKPPNESPSRFYESHLWPYNSLSRFKGAHSRLYKSPFWPCKPLFWLYRALPWPYKSPSQVSLLVMRVSISTSSINQSLARFYEHPLGSSKSPFDCSHSWLYEALEVSRFRPKLSFSVYEHPS